MHLFLVMIYTLKTTVLCLFFEFKVLLIFLQGGFAKCYELTDMDTKEIFAGKIVAKSLLQKPHQKEKVDVLHAIAIV